MSETLSEYFEALRRLKANKPINVPINSRINNDTVALEAGRKRGSIKKSRHIFSDLIAEIHRAAVEQARPESSANDRIEKYKADAVKYRKLWEEALAREVSLIHQLHETQEELTKLILGKVTAIKNNGI